MLPSTIATTDHHTAGEPFCIVADPPVPIPGATVADRRRLRERDSALLARGTVVVEDAATALREAGDVVLAIADGALSAGDLVTMRDVVTGAAAPPADRPLVVKTVGMSWEDLVVADAVVAAVDRV